MVTFGLVSSVFDYLTFGVLLLFFTLHQINLERDGSWNLSFPPQLLCLSFVAEGLSIRADQAIIYLLPQFLLLLLRLSCHLHPLGRYLVLYPCP